jgi:multiple sugar transport system substrate-binding protein
MKARFAHSVVGRRRFLTVALGALGATAAAAACGGAPAAPTAAPAKPAEPAKAAEPAKPDVAPAAKPGASKSPITLRFTTWWAPLEVGLKDAGAQLKETHPHVTVESEIVPGTDFVAKMEAALVAGTWGDASISNNGVQVKWMEGGHHLDLGPRFKSDNINLEGDYSLGGLEIWEGKVLCQPFDNDPRAIYYNKTAFKEVGAKDPWDDLKGEWTMNDMVEAAKKLNKTEAGKQTRYGLQWNYTSYQEFSPIVWGLGGNYANWETLKYTLDDPKVLEAHQMLHKWAKDDKILITKEATTDLMGAGGAIPFRAGTAGMYHRAAYEVQLMDDVIKDKFEWDAAPLPNIDGSKKGTPVTSANPNFVPAKTRYQDEAYEWVKLLAGERFQNFAAERKLFVPSNKKAWKTYQTVNTKGKHLESFIKHVYGRPHGFHFYNAGMNAAGSAIDAELDGAYLGKQTLQQALANAQKKANEVVNFGSAKQPFKFTVPKQPEADLAKWGVA